MGKKIQRLRLPIPQQVVLGTLLSKQVNYSRLLEREPAKTRSRQIDVLRHALEFAAKPELAYSCAWQIRSAKEIRYALLDAFAAEVEAIPAWQPPAGPVHHVLPALAGLGEVAREDRKKVFPGLPREVNAERYMCLANLLPLAGGDIGPETVEALAEEFPNHSDAAALIADDLRLRSVAPDRRYFGFRPLLLVGPPGCGKTRFCRRLAQLAGVPLRVIAAAGMSDNRDLAGTARGWSTAEPGAVIRTIADHQVANPLVLVDEIEKAGSSRRNGRIVDTLVQLLEPETARRFHDDCLQHHADLSAVNWVATCNSLDGLPEPLLSRFTIVRVTAPGAEAFEAIYEAIVRDIAEEFGVEIEDLPRLDPLAVEALRRGFAAGLPIRAMKRATERAMAASLRPIGRPN